jgi:hypothetical protein
MDEGACPIREDRLTPLVVDWKGFQRSALETQMRDAVAVVSYDCHSIQLLEDCNLAGTYGYAGVSRKEEVIQILNSDEAKANLPKLGAKLGVDFEGEFSRGASIDIATVLVGRLRTTIQEANREQLSGNCARATHFVRGAYVGAFAMDRGTRANLRSAASIFGSELEGKSSSQAFHRTVDGDRARCAESHSGDEAPPDQCGGLLRVELVAINAATSRQEAAVIDPEGCPQGFVYSGGKCAKPSSTSSHACKSGDLRDCSVQCERGSAASCNTLGWMHDSGKGTPKNLDLAMEAYIKGCDGKNSFACNALGSMYDNGRGVAQDFEQARELYEQACDDGNSYGCRNLGFMYFDARGVPKDQARGAALFKQACDSGNAFGCTDYGITLSYGSGVTEDREAAAEFCRRGCEGGNSRGCGALALFYEQGRGVSLDLARAVELYRKGCAEKDAQSCKALERLGEQ